jgi:DNA end-binding protein Ku
MRATNKIDIEIGQSDVPISVYSAVEQEIHLKQVSACCSAEVKYKRFCASCDKELDYSSILKAIEVGEDKKVIDSSKLKADNGNLKILGIIKQDNEENGIFKDGSIYFIGFQQDKKNKAKTERNLIKFSYLRESLNLSGVFLIGIVSLRGKEHIVLLKPFYNAFLGLGLYHSDRIRQINEIDGFEKEVEMDKNVLSQMSENLKHKESIAVKEIENKRQKLIEQEIESGIGEKPKVEKEIAVAELVNF